MNEDLKQKVLIRIVDDDALVRESLCFMLACHGWRSTCYDSARAFLSADASTVPGCLLLDIRMPGKDGVAALKEILAARPDRKVIMLTTAGTEEDVYQSLTIGAKGYVMKDSAPGNIVDAIRAVAEGRTYVPEEIRKLYEARSHAPELTPRELETLQLLAQGLSNREIAARLGVSENGAKVHLKHVNEKLDAKDRVDAVAIGLRKGLLHS